MILDFIYKRRLFANPIRLDFYGAFIFELILAADIWAILVSRGDLEAFASNQPTVTTSPWIFMLFAGVGLYGIRVAMYIAIIRRNRAPQALEWAVTLLGLGFTLICLVLGSSMLGWYAELHGYDRCPATSSRTTAAVFAKHQTPCPKPDQP